MRNTFLKLVTLPMALLGAAPLTFCQQDHFTYTGGSNGGNSGRAVAMIGDVNGDGRDEFAVGAPDDDTSGLNRGRVRVYSGIDGTLLYTLSGAEDGDRFGSVLAALGDVNVDGTADFAIGAPTASPGGLTFAGQVRVVSGSNGATIATFNGAVGSGRFGSAIAYAGSIAGARRIAIGAPYEGHGAGGEGSIYLYFGTGGFLKEWAGTQQDEHFGSSLSGGVDINNDNDPDLAAGAPGYDSGGDDTGRVKILDVKSPYSTHTTLVGAGPGHRFGQSVAALEDVNGDGFGDVAIGAPYFSGDRGAVYVHSGSGYGILHVKQGPTSTSHLGVSVSTAGDRNLDGKTDFLAGAPDASGTGSAHLYSGANGSELASFAGPQADARFGEAVHGGGDVNNDGRPDFIVGAPEAAVAGPDAGQVRVISGLTFGNLYVINGPVSGDALGSSLAMLGDVNGDGRADILVGAPFDDVTTFLMGLPVLLENGGSVRCLSGVNGSVLWTIQGGAAGDLFGTSIAPLGDVNGDLVPDFVVGATQRLASVDKKGYARICSGVNGQTLYTYWSTAIVPDAETGAAVASAGFVDGDSVPDVLIGIPGYSDNRGRVAVLSGATGLEISNPAYFGTLAGERFGSAVAGGIDFDNDGLDDTIVGAPLCDVTGVNSGRVYGRSAAGASLFVLEGGVAGDAFGSSLTTIADVNGDGRRDFVVGIPGYDGFAGTNVGAVRAYAGLAVMHWQGSGVDDNDWLGSSLASIGDTNHDGYEDVLAGATESDYPTPGAGYAAVLSGKMGFKMFVLRGLTSGDVFGSSVAGGSDLDGDGFTDVAIGASGADPNGPGSGLVKVISLDPAGVARFGASTPGCQGAQSLYVSGPPAIGTPIYEFSTTLVPVNSLGLLLIGDAQDAAGTDVFAVGVNLHVDVFQSRTLLAPDAVGTDDGFGLAAAPIPNNPAIVGLTFYAQSIWLWSECALPPYGLSSSDALTITIQD